MESCKKGNVYTISSELCLYYVGDNESLKEQTIIGFFKNAKMFNLKLTAELSFPFNTLNKLAYRNIVKNTIRWTSKFTEKSTIHDALNTIGYSKNYFLDRFATLIARIVIILNRFSQTIYLINT